MGRIGVEKAAAVGPKLLDDLLARHRSDRDALFRPFQRRGVNRSGKRLRHAERNQQNGPEHSDGQQNVEGDSGQIGPEIADSGRRGPRKAAHQCKGHREAGRRGDEIVHGEAEHLRQMAHRRLAGVVLPVGVGDEADRRVEGEIRRHGVEAAWVQRQQALEPLNSVENEEARDGEGQHRQRIGEPVLLARRVHPG